VIDYQDRKQKFTTGCFHMRPLRPFPLASLPPFAFALFTPSRSGTSHPLKIFGGALLSSPLQRGERFAATSLVSKYTKKCVCPGNVSVGCKCRPGPVSVKQNLQITANVVVVVSECTVIIAKSLVKFYVNVGLFFTFYLGGGGVLTSGC